MAAHPNGAVRRDPGFTGLFTDEEYARVRTYFESHPELTATPLRPLAGLAGALGIAWLDVKDESARFGIEAFKIVGARYAVAGVPREDLGRGVTCATAGNHGRAVARVARDLDVACTVFVPAPDARAPLVELATRAARIAAMRADGATVVDVDGSYEQAVARAAAHGGATGATVISDTSWPGYDTIPRAIMAGYTWLFEEAGRQWEQPPDVVLVQGGVGGLVCAAASWFARRLGPNRPYLIACEPASAACLLESARAGRMVDLDGFARAELADRTIMAGLRCAVPSPAAWPTILSGIDAFISIPDSIALEALECLSHPASGDPVVRAGPSGACGIGAVLALAREPLTADLRERVAFGQSTRVMAVVTEGP